jgi:2-polyprenyl-3-methyl-5-hydroxy-6-metoxy-1,4-benzoquinol methylase
MSVLKKAGYTYDPESCLWISEGHRNLGYSDGDAVENKLARIVAEATDLSLFSSQLASHRTDWPTFYHLSADRANILQPVRDWLRTADVLEVGAGCGAVTRALGEFGAQVLALEGSRRRAAIARSRTRDLSNVTVVVDKFEEFQTDQQFDVVTLIGVLEYASMFSNDDMAAAGMLKRTCELIAPGGKLIVAIENQLGLKYFGGFFEDHLGKAMYGVEDRYRPGQPRTFGRERLAALLKGAGFVDLKFYVPFPDYKLPTSILT